MKIIIVSLSFFFPIIVWSQVSTVLSFEKAPGIRCLEQLTSFEYQLVDERYQLVQKQQLSDIVQAIQSGGFPYKFSRVTKDRAFSMLVPVWLNAYSLSVGDDHILLSFDSGNDSLADCIVLSYEFSSSSAKLTANNFGCAWTKRGSITLLSKRIDLYQNLTGIYAGELVLSNDFRLSYFTQNKASEEQLHTCLLSFNFH